LRGSSVLCFFDARGAETGWLNTFLFLLGLIEASGTALGPEFLVLTSLVARMILLAFSCPYQILVSLTCSWGGLLIHLTLSGRVGGRRLRST
jgi:hypothetical protein